jgi:hypothetical protein
MVILSQKPFRRLSRPPRASRVVERARATVADRRGLAPEQRARGVNRTAARSLLTLGAASATQRLNRRARGVGREEENFPPYKLLKTHETELECYQVLPHSEEAEATAATVSPNRKGRGASFLGVVRGNRRGMREAKFSCPQSLEKAQNGEGISQAVAPPSSSSRHSGERRGFTISSAWPPGQRPRGTDRPRSV